MKKKLLIITILTLLISGCGAKNAKDPIEDPNTTNQAIITPAPIEVEQSKVYMGQVLDTNESDGIVEVYDTNSYDGNVVCTLKDYEEVELIETVPFGWFKVKLKDGTEGYAEAISIRTKEIPPHEYNKNSSEYVLIFTQDDQTLKIYKNGELVKESLGSSGLWDYFTPRGIFQIEDGRRGEWSYIERFESGFKYWVGFRWIYLFHSVVFDKDGNLIEEEAEKIGEPASHGCIRLPEETAKYIYDNVPVGSFVLIY